MEDAKLNVIVLGNDPQYIQKFRSALTSMQSATSKRTAIQTVSKLLLVKAEDVFACNFDEECHLWNMRMVDGTEYKLKKQTTAKMILGISPYFAQIRQDRIINLEYLASIENYTLRCTFYPPFDQEEAFSSRRCYKEVKEKLEIL